MVLLVVVTHCPHDISQALCNYHTSLGQWDTDEWYEAELTGNKPQKSNNVIKPSASRLFTQPFIQTQIKENIKAPRHWPLCGEFTGASNAENITIWWRHND